MGSSFSGPPPPHHHLSSFVFVKLLIRSPVGSPISLTPSLVKYVFFRWLSVKGTPFSFSVVGQLTVQLSSLLGAVSCLETSFIFETCLRNLGKINSSLCLVVRKARGVARTKTWKLLIRNRGSSLHYCQVVGFESSPLDKRELWNKRKKKGRQIIKQIPLKLSSNFH